MIQDALFLFFIGTGFLSICFLLLLRYSFMIITIEKQSMYPVLVPGDRILALRHWPAHWLRKGQIVILKIDNLEPSQTAPESSSPMFYIKRIIGVAGETFLTTSEGEEQVFQSDHRVTDAKQHLWTIPASALLVRGDNRANSLDSHMWGPMSVKCVQAVMLRPLRRNTHALAQERLLKSISHPFTQGEEAPIFHASTLNGELVDRHTYVNQHLLLIFFSPARALTRDFFQHHLHIPGIVEGDTRMILVSGVGRKRTQAFLKNVCIDLPVIIAPSATNPMFHDYRVELFPAYCHIDAQGKILATGVIPLDAHSHTWRIS